jgi:hypothetical protein
VQVFKTDLPTFFARIWGVKNSHVRGYAIAEACNASPPPTPSPNRPPVASLCVKPWLLPNKSPFSGSPIFAVADGSILDPSLLGRSLTGGNRFTAAWYLGVAF